MNGLRVLITNCTLAGRTGTETYVRDLSLGLLRRGHCPVVYTPEPGELAREIQRAGVPVVPRLGAIALRPDVIHGHHLHQTMEALLHFPGVPGIFVCHDRLAWHDAPPNFPRLRQYIAVDENCRDRMVCEHAVDPDKIRVILNSVDLDRFVPRAPLPAAPRRALLFASGDASPHTTEILREVCIRAEIELDVMGAGFGCLNREPEKALGQYDLIFAKARCALEALAVGAAVILWGRNHMGPMVTSTNVDHLRRWNFGQRCLARTVSLDHIVREIDRFDAVDAAHVSHHVRTHAGLSQMLDELIDRYHAVIGESYSPALASELRAAAAYLNQTQSHGELKRLRGELARLEAECQGIRAERDAARNSLHDLLASRTFRIQCRLSRVPGLKRLARLVMPSG